MGEGNGSAVAGVDASRASGEVYSHLGFVYSKLGKTDLAAKASRTAIKKDPRSLAGYENLYSIYLRSKQVQQALSRVGEAADAVRGRTPGS